jgi:hypothetical protein
MSLLLCLRTQQLLRFVAVGAGFLSDEAISGRWRDESHSVGVLSLCGDLSKI